jgi:hypothetical protein
MWHKGKSSLISNEHQNHIIQYYEELRDRGIPVSSQILAIKLLHVDPQWIDVDAIICHHILCFMKNIHVTHHCITHKPQNTRFHEHIINHSSDIQISRLSQVSMKQTKLLTLTKLKLSLMRHPAPQ